MLLSFLDTIESEKPYILKLDGRHVKLLDHLITPSALSKIRVLMFDMPPHLYEGNVKTAHILDFLVAVNFPNLANILGLQQEARSSW